MLFLKLRPKNNISQQLKSLPCIFLQGGKLEDHLQFVCIADRVEDIEAGSVIGQQSSEFVVVVGVRGDDAIDGCLPEGEG